jgi:hypothetical protein
LKTELTLRCQAVWQTLTEVPGWPDAPRAVRVRRMLPIAFPATAFFGLLLWHFAWAQPSMARVRAEHEPVLQLAREVEALRAVSSESASAAVATQASEAARMLLENSAALAAELQGVQELARSAGWQATAQVLPPPPEARPETAMLQFLPARLRLVPLPGNTTPFPSLLTLIEQLSAAKTRIDLTRLTVRADEEGRQSVELHLQLASRRLP